MSTSNLHIIGVDGCGSLSDRIYALVLARLQRGEITAEERLIDSTLAAQFNVSRMPARDALMRLANEGYLEQTTRGFVLPRFSQRDILDIFTLRRLVEPHAIALAAQHIDAKQIADLESALAEARAAAKRGETEKLFRACEVMRNGWIAAVPNKSLQNVLFRYMTHIQAVRMMTFGSAHIQTTVVSSYADLVAALRDHNSVAASERLLRFIFEGEAAYIAASAEHPENLARGRSS